LQKAAHGGNPLREPAGMQRSSATRGLPGQSSCVRRIKVKKVGEERFAGGVVCDTIKGSGGVAFSLGFSSLEKCLLLCISD